MKGKNRAGVRRIITALLTAAMILGNTTQAAALTDTEELLTEVSSAGDEGIFTGSEDSESILQEDVEISADEIYTDGIYTDEQQDASAVIRVDVSDQLIQNGGFPKAVSADEAADTVVSGDEAEKDALDTVEAPEGYIYESASDAVAEAVMKWNGSDSAVSVDISTYKIPYGNFQSFLQTTINLHPECFFLTGMATCFLDDQNCVTYAEFEINKNYSKSDIDTFENKVTSILNGIESEWSDLQKFIYIHDYLVMHTSYDLSQKKRTAYDAIVGGSSVCQGYALASEYLFNRVNKNFACQVVTSETINHAWNLAVLNGKTYYMDMTWDDPVGMYEYLNTYVNFLKSRDVIHSNHNSTDWVNVYGEPIYSSVSGGTEYDSAPWSNMRTVIPMFGKKGVYCTDGDQAEIYLYDFSTGQTLKKIYSYTDKWPFGKVPNSYYKDRFTSMAAFADYVVITLPESIKLIDLDGNEVASYDELLRGGCVYGAVVDNNNILYDIYDNPPNVEPSEYVGRGIRSITGVEIKVKEVRLNKESVAINAGSTYKLKATVKPDAATNKVLSWTSGDEAIARVDQNGLVTGIAQGKTTIWAETTDGSNRYAECVVVVNKGKPVPVPATGIVLEPKTLELGYGSSQVIKATIEPANATERTIIWSSDNDSIVSVESDGRVTGVSLGSATIKATIANTGIFDTCTVTVKALDIPVNTVTLNKRSIKLVMGEAECLYSFYYPSNASAEISYESSDTNVVTVSGGNGMCRIYAAGAGQARVTAKDKGGASAYCTVTVTSEVADADAPLRTSGLWIGAIDNEVYDGTARKPEPNVYFGDHRLIKDVDYTISYRNNTNAGSPGAKNSKGKSIAPTVIAKFKGSYSGSRERQFTIEKADIESTAIDAVFGVVSVKKQGGREIYKEQKLVPVITYRGKKLKNKTDYTLIYPDSKEGAYSKAGSYSISVNGIGNFKGTASTTETLVNKANRIDINKVKVERLGARGDLPYTGNPVEPKFRLSYKPSGSKAYVALEYDKDYKVLSSNNVEPGTARVSFTAMGDKFYGVKTVTFKIVKVKKSFKSVAPVVSINGGNTQVYEKGGVKPSVNVTYKGELLAEGIDYKVSYKNNNRAEYTRSKPAVVIKGIGDYKDSFTKEFSISKQDISLLNLCVDDLTYSKNVNAFKKPKIKIFDVNGKLLSSSDFYIDNTKWPVVKKAPASGSIMSVTIKGKGNYSGTITGSFRIVNKTQRIDSAKIAYKTGGDASYDSGSKAFIYKGKAVEPSKDNMTLSLAVKSGGKKITVNPTYEIVAYENNLKAGTAKVTVRGTGQYAGLKTFTFKIIKAK